MDTANTNGIHSQFSTQKSKLVTILKDVVGYNLGVFLYYGAQWIISVFLIRLGDFENAGYFSLAISVCNIFTMIANYGLRSYQLSDISNYFSDSIYNFSRFITVVIAFVLCALYSVKNPECYWIIIIYMGYKCIEAYSDALNTIFQKEHRTGLLFLSFGLKGILNLTAFLITYLITKQLILSLTAMTLASLIILLLIDIPFSTLISKKLFSLKQTKKEKILKLLKIGFWTMLYCLLVTAFSSIPRIIIQNHVGTEELGIFATISTPTVLISTFANGLLVPLTPRMREYYIDKDKKGLSRLILLCILVFIIVSVIAFLLLAFLGRPLFRIFLGDSVMDYYVLIYQMVAVSMLISMNSCYTMFFVAVRSLKLLDVFSLCACVLVSPFTLLFIPKNGIYGASYAMLFVLICQFLAESIYVIKKIHDMNRSKQNVS